MGRAIITLVRDVRVCEAAGMSESETNSGFALVTVASGARSVRSLEYGETFHPVVGPMAEARGLHVAQSRLVERAAEFARPFVIWDVGLGAGANAIAAIEALSEVDSAAHVKLRSFDCTTEPLEFALRHDAELGYLPHWREAVECLLESGSAVIGNVEWHFQCGDFREFVRDSHASTAPRPDAILYDPYSPEANPGMWSLEHFRRLRACLDATRPCTLTNYSRSTAVRVTLMFAGFFVGRGGATGEKDQTTVAATHRELLEQPLDSEWLGRVGRSTHGAPRREGADAGAISPEDLAALRAMLAGNREQMVRWPSAVKHSATGG
jgi:tRNA U34 5-methylaminomethyl-2-thiouridine-forming methyltransferase MnmC